MGAWYPRPAHRKARAQTDRRDRGQSDSCIARSTVMSRFAVLFSLAAAACPGAHAEDIPSNAHLGGAASARGDSSGTCVGANTATDMRSSSDPRAACDPANPETQPSPERARNRDTGRGERSRDRDRADQPLGLFGGGTGAQAGSAASGTGFGPHAGNTLSPGMGAGNR
jgi:hypothetical protein